MALFLVTGPRGSGKSTLIRNMGGVERIAETAARADHLINLAAQADIWMTTPSEAIADRLRPHAAREYVIRPPWNATP